jgi:hypothetical protein
MSAWTRAAVEALGPTTNVSTAAAIVDVNAETVYTAIRNGTWTATRVLRIGRVIKIPTLDLIRLLYAPEVVATPLIPAVPAQCQHVGNTQVSGHESQSQCGCTSGGPGAVVPLRATS